MLGPTGRAGARPGDPGEPGHRSGERHPGGRPPAHRAGTGCRPAAASPCGSARRRAGWSRCPRESVGEGYALVWDSDRTSLRQVTVGRRAPGRAGRGRERPGPGREGRPERPMSDRPRLRTRPGPRRADLPRRAELHRQGPHDPQVLPLPTGRGRGHADRSTASAPSRRRRRRCWTRGIRVSAAAVGRFAEKLKSMGLCERTLRETLGPAHGAAQGRSGATRLRTGRFQGDILRLRWSIGDPDELMDRTMPYLRFCFTRGFLHHVRRALRGVLRRAGGSSGRSSPRAMTDVYTLRASAGRLRPAVHHRAPWSSPYTSWRTATPASTSAARSTRSAR